ncbi:MAG TPA: glycosyltransferase family 4 protein [Thermoanaerobaculia bacterium]|nr:glycosyltransferase family 4 protein [Thermoanaerobaculia bacterium]
MRGDETLRVLLVANTLPPADVSGVGEQVLQLAAGLRAAGEEVTVLGRGSGGARGPKAFFPLTIVPAAFAALLRLRPHVVQVHESDGALAALLVRLLRPFLRPRPRLVALLQVSYREERRAVRRLVAPDGTVLGRPGAVERRFRRWKAPLQIALGTLAARLADRVLAPSAATAAEVARDYGVAAVGVLPNVTGGLPVPVAAVRAPAELPPGYLLFVGRLRIRKGVEVLLAALDLLRRRREPEVPLLAIAGDGEHRPALEAAAARLGLEDSAVRFLGRADAARVRALLAGARALVVPSTYEGMPLVVLEAMEAGVPVVASRVSGIPEVVVDGETGWLVPPEDASALADVLVEAVADPAEAARRGEAGRGRVEHLYRPRNAAERWRQVVGIDRRAV